MRFRPFHWLLAFVLAAPLSAQKDRGWLGVVLEGDRGKPAQVVEVVPEAPAAKGGVRVGDLILRLNNKSAGDIDQFIEKVCDLKAGSRITLRVRRGDAERNLRIRLGRRPEEHDEREHNEREHNEREHDEREHNEREHDEREHARGEERGERTAKSKAKQGKPRPGFLGVYLQASDKGVSIERIIPGSAAAKAGLKNGDRFLRVQNKAVTSYESFTKQVRAAGAGQFLRLLVDRGGKEKVVEVRLGSADSVPPLPGGVQIERARDGDTREHAAKIDGLSSRTAMAKRAAKAAEQAVKAKSRKKSRAKSKKKPLAKRAPRDGGGWMTDLKSAHTLARRQRRPLVIGFHAEWCKPCKMLSQSFANARVRRALGNAILVKIDVDKNSKLADAHGVSSIPHVIVQSPEGKKLGQFTGFLPADTLAERMSRWLATRGNARGGARSDRAAADLEIRSSASRARARADRARAAKQRANKAVQAKAKQAQIKAREIRAKAAGAKAKKERAVRVQTQIRADGVVRRGAPQRRVTDRNAELNRMIQRLLLSQERTNKLLEQILKKMQ